METDLSFKTDNVRREMKGEETKGPRFRITTLRKEDAPAAQKQFRADVIAGLSGKQKNISSKYFYDDTGSCTLWSLCKSVVCNERSREQEFRHIIFVYSIVSTWRNDEVYLINLYDSNK